MKKLISVLIVITVSIALFALDLNIGVDAMHNYDATATVSAQFGKLEVGGGVYTNAVGNAVAFLLDKENTAAFGEKMATAFKNAEYGALGHVYYDFINTEFKLAAGTIVEFGSFAKIKEVTETKKISMNILAAVKASYFFTSNLGISAQAGAPVATFNISGSDQQFESLVKGSAEEIWGYVKENARIQVGAVLSF